MLRPKAALLRARADGGRSADRMVRTAAAVLSSRAWKYALGLCAPPLRRSTVRSKAGVSADRRAQGALFHGKYQIMNSPDDRKEHRVTVPRRIGQPPIIVKGSADVRAAHFTSH